MAHATNGSVEEKGGHLICVIAICPKCGRIVTRITEQAPFQGGYKTHNCRCGYCKINFPVTVTG